MHFTQLAESNLAADEHLLHLALECRMIAIEHGAEVLQARSVGHPAVRVVELEINERFVQDFDLLPRREQTQPEVIFNQTRQPLIEACDVVPGVPTNRKNRRNASDGG